MGNRNSRNTQPKTRICPKGNHSRREGGAIIAKMYKLWTIQRLSFFDELMQNGTIESNWDYVDRDLHFAYKWICGQMLLRNIPIGSKPPIWAWYRYEGKHKKPDLRKTLHLPRGEKGVCIDFEIEKESVLLSEFNMWHYVLNNVYLSTTQQEELLRDGLEKEGRLELAALHKSWERIFDIDAGDENWFGKRENRQIQACIPKFKIENVRAVRYLTGR